jgi:hypothetical protein
MPLYTIQQVQEQEANAKKTQEDLMWKERTLEHQHPLLDKQYPSDYQAYFEELEQENRPLKKELTTLRHRNASQIKALQALQDGERIVWATRFQQKIHFKKSPFAIDKIGGYYQAIDDVCPEQPDHQTRNAKRWMIFSRQQPSCLFKVLQELYTDEADLMLSTEKTSRKILDTEAINWVCINPERIADETYEKLSGESLEGMTGSEIVEKKSLFIPLLKKILKHAQQIAQQEKRGRKKPIKKFFMIDFPAHPISDGCILVLSTHEYKDRLINRPQLQVLRSAYDFQRSFLHIDTKMSKDITELKQHGMALNQQVTDNLPATEEEEQAMHAALSSVIEKIEGKTRKETHQALQKLTAAVQPKDTRGQKNPPAKRLQLLSGKDNLKQGITSVIQKKTTIASYEDIFAKMLKEHETRLFKMKEIINYFRATYHFPYPKEKIQLLVQKLESKIPDRKNELPVIKPFSIYYTTLEKELQKLKTQMDHSHYDDIPKILDNMDYILHHFAVLQSVETFWHDRLQTPDTDKTAFLKTFWENHQSFLKQYTERLAQGQEKGKKNKFVDQWNEFMTLLEDFVTNINENDLCALCIRLDTIFNSQFIQYL